MFLRCARPPAGGRGRGPRADRQRQSGGPGDGHIERGFVALAANRFADAGVESNAALKLLRSAPGGAVAANALLALQGEFHLRTAAREKGRATLEEVAKRLRAAPGPDAWSQALFTLEAIARAARAVGDWELADALARQLLEHDPAFAGGHYALALVAEHNAGARPRARTEFAQAVKFWAKADPDLPELAEMQAQEPVAGRAVGASSTASLLNRPSSLTATCPT